MPDEADIQLIRTVQIEAATVLDERARLRDAVANRTAEIAALESEARALEVRGQASAAEQLRNRILAKEGERSRELVELRRTDERFREVLERVERIDPCDADPSLPLVLFPVRIETRYSDNGSTLRVRIFPDTIHIDQLDRGMTEEEVKAGRAFWTSARSGGDAVQKAWDALAGAVGAKRATWVATGLTPTNRIEWLAGAEPVFPSPGARDRAAALARLLPDRFVVVAQQGRNRSEARTRPIPPEVVTGILSEDGTGLVDVGGAKVPAGGEWMVDYAAAVEIGLAVDLRLATPGPVDRLYVIGVRGSLDPDRSREELAALFTSHRCSRGIGIAPQGSATNNTDGERSEWAPGSVPDPPAHLLADRPTPAETSAAVLARALGIEAAALEGVPHWDVPEQARARAMNVALWPASWGAFLDRLSDPDSEGTKPALTDAVEQGVRDFFRDHVRGRGPLPNLRVGDQPYGILPVSASIDGRFAPTGRDAIESKLLPMLRSLRSWWKLGAASTPYIGNGEDIDTTFREILGQYPVSPAMRARNGVSEGTHSVAVEGGFAEAISWEIERQMGAILLQVLGIDPAVVHPLGSLSHRSRALPYPLVHASDPEYMEGLLSGSPPKVKSLLQAMLGIALDAAERDVAAAAPKDKLRQIVEMATGLDARQKALVLAAAGGGRAGVDAQLLHREADRMIAASGVQESGRHGLKQYQPISSYRTSYADLALNSSLDVARAELATLGTIAWVRATARLTEVREAIAMLRQTTLRERAILFGELLDLCSHRLDAWITGIIDRRLQALRSERSAGLTIGAYGWVENLRPGAGSQPDGGYIHAPSLNHAATAGILRSAFLTHNVDETGDGAFAVDLSSERVRTALHVVDGILQGQQLGALLGYRIERALHEVRLDRLIVTLRRLAPLVALRLTDRNESVPAPAVEAIAASNVVDGLRLIERFGEGAQARAGIRQALNDPPVDNPYIEAGDWPPLTDEEWAKVEKIVEDAAGVEDAAADLLLAESVHQLVQGNTARSAATLSASGSGEVPPPDPEVIKTPAPGMTYSHRVMLIADGDAQPWNAARPRAIAAPELERWAAQRLGSPEDVVVWEGAEGESLTLAETGLSALDVIYDSGDRRTLEQRVRATLPQIDPEAILAMHREADWPAGKVGLGEIAELAAALRGVLVTAKPAAPADFSRASDPPLRSISPAALAEVVARGNSARGLLGSAADALEAALTPPGGAPPNPQQILAALESLAAFGAVTPAVEQENLESLAQVALAEARQRLARADDLLASTGFDSEDAASLGAALFGDGFWILPRIEPAPGGDLFSSSWGTLTPARAELRRYVRDIGSVREPMARLSKALLLADALGRPATLGAAQLATHPYPWVGGVLGNDLPAPEEPVTSVLVQPPPGWDPGTATSALMVDQWADVVPELIAFGGEEEGEAAEISDRRSSGVAVNAASASSRPPQAVLLAISPDGSRWDTERLVAVLDETLELARLRTVTLERAPGAGRFLPAVYLPGWSVGGRRAIDIRYAAENAHLASALSYVKEQP